MGVLPGPGVGAYRHAVKETRDSQKKCGAGRRRSV